MFRFSMISILVMLIPACSGIESNDEVSRSTGKQAVKIQGLPISFTIQQRSTLKVPGSQGLLAITIGDITRGQTIVSMLSNNQILAGPISMKPGELRTFSFDDNQYRMQLDILDNSLAGEDYATFTLKELIDATLSENQKIEMLILAVEKLEDATFLRNGTSYSCTEAANHLRRKWAASKNRIRTAEEFVDRVASKSHTTGNDYFVRLANGETLRASEFFSNELKTLMTRDNNAMD